MHARRASPGAFAGDVWHPCALGTRVIFLAELGKRLVVLHALAAMVLLGAVSHQVVVAAAALRGKLNPRLVRVYGAIGVVAGVITIALGAVTYPSYRYYVRGLYLDHCDVSASKLFDIKEDLAVFALLLAGVVWLVGRELERRSPRACFELYAGAALALACLVWFDALSGFLITLARGMP
jgi:hypothetical protein